MKNSSNLVLKDYHNCQILLKTEKMKKRILMCFQNYFNKFKVIKKRVIK